MPLSQPPAARVTMLIHASPGEVYQALVEPEHLTRFWLSEASGPLQIGKPVDWTFMVPGAHDRPTATRLAPGEHIAWRWSDGTVRIDLEPFGDGTAVTLVSADFTGSEDDQVAAALNSVEGFTIVLCDLKTLLESGTSAGLTKAKAQLIEARR